VPFFDANEKSANDILLMNTIQTPELGEAAFYNNLPQTLEKAWSLLEDAVRNRHSPMHTPVAVAKITPPAKSGHKHHSLVATVTSRKKRRAYAPPNPPPAFQLTLKTVSPELLSQKRDFATLPQ